MNGSARSRNSKARSSATLLSLSGQCPFPTASTTERVKMSRVPRERKRDRARERERERKKKCFDKNLPRHKQAIKTPFEKRAIWMNERDTFKSRRSRNFVAI